MSWQYKDACAYMFILIKVKWYAFAFNIHKKRL